MDKNWKDTLNKLPPAEPRPEFRSRLRQDARNAYLKTVTPTVASVTETSEKFACFNCLRFKRVCFAIRSFVTVFFSKSHLKDNFYTFFSFYVVTHEKSNIHSMFFFARFQRIIRSFNRESC